MWMVITLKGAEVGLSSKLAKARAIAASSGLRGVFFASLYRLGYKDVRGLGRWAARLGNRAKVDGVAIRMNSRFIEDVPRGQLVLGLYEAPERALTRKYFPRDEPVVELGASIGVVTCVVSRRLAPPARYVAVEAHPGLIPVLEGHRRINRCAFTIVHVAVAYEGDHITFYPNEGSLGGSVHRQASAPVLVPTTSLEAIADQAGFGRFNLICDIEGSEIDLIDHELDFMRGHVDWILMELHPFISGEREVERALAAMRERGFELVERVEGTYCFRNGGPPVPAERATPAAGLRREPGDG